jgi:hypothetical protein
MSMVDQNPGLPPDEGVPLYVDGSPLDAINFVKIEATKYISSERSKSDTTFWSSVPRRQADTTTEVYEVALTSRQLVNTLAFSLARFPHRVMVQYQDADGNWLALRQSFGTPVEYAVTDSLPATISPQAVQQGALHPQHYGAGHWIRHKALLKPVKTRRIRLLLTRGVGAPPVDHLGNTVPYSLGVRELALGYRVVDKKNVPRGRRHPTVRTEFDPFSTGVDSLGSPLAYSVRENRADDLLNGLSWRSEPMPVPDAVVSLYLDTRDADGVAPVVDRFRIDPLTPGVQLNLYYSNDDSESVSFKASEDILSFPRSFALGAVTQKDEGLEFGTPDASVTLDNTFLQWRGNHPWWIGYNFTPNFDETDTLTRVLLDTGNLLVTLTAGVLSAQLGTRTISQNLTFDVGSRLTFVLVFYDNALWLVSPSGPASTGGGDNGIADELASIAQIRFGSNIDDLVGSANIVLNGFIIKQETQADPVALYDSFVANSDDFLAKPEFDYDDTGGTDNALVRFHPSFPTPGVSSVNPLGFVGGTGDLYEDKEWTPVARDFRLERGMLHFPPVRAKYFKFEFTELVAEPYDTFAQVTRRVKRHPQWLLEQNKKNKKGGPRKANAKGGFSTSIDESAYRTNYRDERRTFPVGFYPISATTSAVSSDPSLAQRMRQISSYYNLVKWLPGTLNTKWRSKGKHSYQTVDIDHVHRVAYFVGINAIEMFRLDYTADDDSEQYIEVFHDDANLTTNEWVLGDTSAQVAVVPAVMQSKVLASRRKVRAVQFATVQSPPIQLIQDADFLDSTLATWDAYGDAAPLTFSQELETDLGSTVRVSRQLGAVAQNWDDVEYIYPNWNLIEGTPWQDLESDGSGLNVGGIEGNQIVASTAQGRLYAAARVFVNETLSSPLYLQIVTEDNEVVSEEQIEPQPGQITEWFTGYTIGAGGESTALDWDGMEATYADWDAVEAAGSWNQAAQETAFLTTRVKPRLIQYGLSDDEWDVDNISLFNDPIVWEFSNNGGSTFHTVYDIRNNPDGVFVFPDYDVLDPSPGYSTKLSWRVTAYHPSAWVTSLIVRPWYTGLSLGIPHREAIQYGGPNSSPWDDYPEIHEDPHWMMWDVPVPQDWWFRFRRDILPTLVPTTPEPVTVLPEGIVVGAEADDPDLLVLNDPFVI